jgi:hypothetical protein
LNCCRGQRERQCVFYLQHKIKIRSTREMN